MSTHNVSDARVRWLLKYSADEINFKIETLSCESLPPVLFGSVFTQSTVSFDLFVCSTGPILQVKNRDMLLLEGVKWILNKIWAKQLEFVLTLKKLDVYRFWRRLLNFAYQQQKNVGSVSSWVQQHLINDQWAMINMVKTLFPLHWIITFS